MTPYAQSFDGQSQLMQPNLVAMPIDYVITGPILCLHNCYKLHSNISQETHTGLLWTFYPVGLNRPFPSTQTRSPITQSTSLDSLWLYYQRLSQSRILVLFVLAKMDGYVIQHAITIENLMFQNENWQWDTPWMLQQPKESTTQSDLSSLAEQWMPTL